MTSVQNIETEYAHCQGRNFRRKEAFLALPIALQEDVEQCELYLTVHRDEIFSVRHHPQILIKSVYGCKARELNQMVLSWLQEVKVSPLLDKSCSDETRYYAQEIVDGLILDGFVSMLKDTEVRPALISRSSSISMNTSTQDGSAGADQSDGSKSKTGSLDAQPRKSEIPNATVSNGDSAKPTETTQVHLFRDNDILIPNTFGDSSRIGVWDVVEGAVYAGIVKRKAGIFATFTQGKDVYAVVNLAKNSLYLFETDTSRETLSTVDLKEPVEVQCDETFFEFGINILYGDTCVETLNCLSKDTQQDLLKALVRSGAKERDAVLKPQSTESTFYDMEDRVLGSDEVIKMEKYKGKVVLVVNVATKSSSANANFQDLIYLHDKFHEHGLEILAFPCNQFGGNEPGDSAEIANYALQHTVNFQFFEKGDVNGSEARPIFVFLKSKLPDTFGRFIKWDFTKFLIDRDGNPLKRFAPKHSPKMMEPFIKELLFGKDSDAQSNNDQNIQDDVSAKESALDGPVAESAQA